MPGWEGLEGSTIETTTSTVPGHYPKDTLEYRGKTIVEYKTPAQTEGLGNFDSWLGENDTPIIGAAILIVDQSDPIGNLPDLDMVRLSVRFPPDLARLTPAIVRCVERDAVGAPRKGSPSSTEHPTNGTETPVR